MLTSKQRAYLIGLSNTEPVLLQIGRNGVTPESVASAEEIFNGRELFKGSVLKNCPEQPEDCARMLAERTRAELVRVIGRKFILYRADQDKPVIELP